MNSVGEGGNQSSVTAPTSVADVPPAIAGADPVLAEAKLKMAEKRFTDVAEQAAPSSGITTEDLPKPRIEEYFDTFGKLGEEPKITLSSKTPTLNDLPTKETPTAFNESVPVAALVNEPVSKQGDLQTNIGNTISAAEVVQQAEKTPKEEIIEEFSKILDNYSIEKTTEKVPA